MVKLIKYIRSFFLSISNLVKYQSLELSSKTITFYSENENYWPHFRRLIKELLKETNLSFCYVSSSSNDPGLHLNNSRIKSFLINSESIKNYFFYTLETKLMIMTMPDLDNYQIKKSRKTGHYMFIQHSLVSMHMIYRFKAFDNFDSISCCGPHHNKEIREMEKKYLLPNKKLFNHGYSRFDDLINDNRYKNKQLFNTILVAPSWGENCIIESGIGKKLIGELLMHKFNVIFRPHPQTIVYSREAVNDVIDKYIHNKQFSYEENIVSDKSLFTSEILITDWSGIALEYSLALKKPVIFCNTPKKINNLHYKDIKSTPIEISLRSKIGVIWDLKMDIREVIENSRKIKLKELKNLSHEHIYNHSKSAKEFIKFINENFKFSK